MALIRAASGSGGGGENVIVARESLSVSGGTANYTISSVSSIYEIYISQGNFHSVAYAQDKATYTIINGNATYFKINSVSGNKVNITSTYSGGTAIVTGV